MEQGHSFYFLSTVLLNPIGGFFCLPICFYWPFYVLRGVSYSMIFTIYRKIQIILRTFIQMMKIQKFFLVVSL